MNAKAELLSNTEYKSQILCASIYTEMWDEDGEKVRKYILPKNYTTEQYEAFLDSLNFNYNNGHGIQHLFGIVWFVDGTWMERGEYDGAEWWEYRICPKIPGECK